MIESLGTRLPTGILVPSCLVVNPQTFPRCRDHWVALAGRGGPDWLFSGELNDRPAGESMLWERLAAVPSAAWLVIAVILVWAAYSELRDRLGERVDLAFWNALSYIFFAATGAALARITWWLWRDLT